MITLWEVIKTYERVKTGRWRTLVDGYGSLEWGLGWMLIYGQDGSRVDVRFENYGSVVHVVVYDAQEREQVRVRCVNEQKMASVVELGGEAHSALDLLAVMSYAQCVWWDERYGYVSDVLVREGRILVIEFFTQER